MYFKSLRPDVFISSTSVTFWSRLIIIFLLSLRILTSNCFSRFSFSCLYLLLYFWCLLRFFCLLFPLFSLLFFLNFFLLFSLLFLFLLQLLFLLTLLQKFIEMGLAVVCNNLFSFFLVGKKVGISPKKAEDSIKEAVYSSFLLNHGHKDAIELVVLAHIYL